MNVNAFLQKDYENETAFRPKKTNPIQTQSKPMDRKRINSPILPKLTKCPIYRRFTIDVDNENR